jgi:molybdopterin/thiamine biosynthesis adenylyltransferase
MKEKLKKLCDENKSSQLLYKPFFFRLSNKTDKIKFEKLLDNPGILVSDEIFSQLEELIKSRTPRAVYSKEQLSEKAKEYPSTAPEEYGVWVYYPWSGRIVHMLDEKEFIEVRTNRNHNKISVKETELLSTKKVGVVGLSVGQSVALTMAMERTFGELRIADFDLLELSNLNRIRTGTHNLSLPKVIAVAREIAEIDPFLKVVIFTEGITEKNIEDFLLKEGKLDILIDECDGLDIKILCRKKAKELSIPVLMEASDRGTVDVERFDLEPERPLLHGLIDHLDISNLKNLKTNEEKIPYLLPFVGLETISTRLKASMLEVGQTISTWPQLASAVVLGGGVTADVCRRILLNQFHESGRYFVDVEEIIGDKKKNIHEVIGNSQKKFSLSNQKLIDSVAGIQTQKDQIEVEQETLAKIITAAAKAPSHGNSQPWKWFYHNKNLYLFHDKEYSGFPDPNNIAAYIALGAASENLILKAHELNLEVMEEKFPSTENALVSIFRFFKKGSALNYSSHDYDHLAKAIDNRVTNRNINKKKVIPQNIISEFKTISAHFPEVSLKILSSEKEIQALAEIIGKSERIRMMHQKMHSDFMNQIRWTDEEFAKSADGIPLGSLAPNNSAALSYQMSRHWPVIDFLKHWGGGSIFEELPKRSAASASALGLITTSGLNAETIYSVGKIIERIWLHATMQNIALQPLNTINFLFVRLDENGDGLSDPEIKELKNLRDQFTKIFSLESLKGVFLFRLFIADKPGKPSKRRSADQILYRNN